MNNNGFTLTEVLVATIVSSILTVGIAIYTIVGIRNFNSARTETQAQQEADFMMMQIKDKIKTIKDYRVYDTGEYYVLEVICGAVDDSGIYRNADFAFVYDRTNTDMYMLSYNDNVGYRSDPYTVEEADEYFSFDADDINEEAKKTSLLSLYATNFTVRPDSMANLDENRTVVVSVEASVGQTTISRSVIGYVRNAKEKIKNSDNPEEGGDEGDDPDDSDEDGD